MGWMFGKQSEKQIQTKNDVCMCEEEKNRKKQLIRGIEYRDMWICDEIE